MSCRIYILTLLFSFIGLLAFGQNIEFIENKGQWDERVRFMGRVSNGAFFIHKDGYTVLQHHSDDWSRIIENSHKGDNKDARLRSHAYRVNFVNVNPAARIVPDKALPTYNNYFIGNDPSRWASECRIYMGITIKDVYPNIDLRYYSDKGTLKYDLIVNPGGRVSDIVMEYTGADGLRLKNKQLVISTSVGELKELSPYTYQPSDLGKTEVQARYILKSNQLKFDVGAYDQKLPLVIDPTLEFCSFSGSQADNWGYTATYGPDGSMFGGGIVAGQGFPISTGAFDGTYNGGEWDIGIIKLSPDGSSMLYSTYIGGAGIEQPHSLICDPQGNLILTGRSNSTTGVASARYPTTGPAFSNSTGYDIVVTKLNAAGTALIGSRMIGGTGDDGVNIRTSHEGGVDLLVQNYGDDGRSEVNIDAAGNVYVASATRSTNFHTSGGFQTTSGGGAQDGVVIKFNPDLSALLFSSYLGGNNVDAAYVVTIAPDNRIYVAGGTASTNLHQVFNTSGTIASASNGGIDGFVAIISNDGSSLEKLTHIGTSAIDQVYGLHFDLLGFPYIMGQTRGNFPVINAPWSQANGKQFISKLQPDLSGFVYSTVFGKGAATPDISPTAFLVDRCENVYVSGWGGDHNFQNAGVQGLTVTPDAIKSSPDILSNGLGGDFYFFVLKKDAASQLYGSFFGQNTSSFHDHVDGGTSRFDREGVIYQAMCASCNNTTAFPTTPGVWAPTKPPSANCNLAMVKIAFNLAGVGSGVQSFIDATTRGNSGCVPLTVDFVDTILTAQQYEWYINDPAFTSPTFTTTPAITHTFNQVGVYEVMLVAIDSNSCNIRDTSYTTITVSDLRAQLDFNAVKLNPCDSFRYRFDNLSQPPAVRPFGAQSFTWDFGDNTPRVTTGPGPVFHNYTSPGTYTVRMFLNDSAYCNFPDTVVKQIRVAALVQADFNTPPMGCAPYTAEFTNTSQAGAQFIWDFGDPNDPTGSNQVNPVHVYSQPGTYTITLIAIDSATCNISDTTSFSITVFGNPVAEFTASPQPPVVNTPISFINQSSPDAIRFKWYFGDGDSLVTTSRDVIQHEYVATGTFNACLIAYNQAGCPDTVCRDVQTLIEPAVDVPNAFTPGKGGINGTVYVRGFGIARMKFTIWARWGEKVFETNSKHIGWNGYYKGKLLPMDVYAYTLDVEFSDGTKTTKTGDITLIR